MSDCRKLILLAVTKGFPGGTSGKEPANVEDIRDAGLGRSPGVGNGNPLQYTCQENPMDREAWLATDHGAAKAGHNWSDLACTLWRSLLISQRGLIRITCSKTSWPHQKGSVQLCAIKFQMPHSKSRRINNDIQAKFWRYRGFKSKKKVVKRMPPSCPMIGCFCFPRAKASPPQSLFL